MSTNQTSYTYYAIDNEYKLNINKYKNLKNVINVPRLGSGTVQITFNSDGKIQNIHFDDRAYIDPESTLEPLFPVHLSDRETQEVCHKIGMCWIKEQTKLDVIQNNLFKLNANALSARCKIKNRMGEDLIFPKFYENALEKNFNVLKDINKWVKGAGQTTANRKKYCADVESITKDIFEKLEINEQFGFFFPEIPDSTLKNLNLSKNIHDLFTETTKAVANLYLNRCTVPSNLFAGDKIENRLGGALSYILQPYVLSLNPKKKNNTSLEFPLHIPLNPNGNKMHDDSCKLVKEQIKKDVYLIENQEILLDKFFECNYNAGSSKTEQSPQSRSRIKQLILYPYVGLISDTQNNNMPPQKKCKIDPE